ncbi:MAG: thiol-disulfide oxidoreductase DCC family protein [Planctomycetota bacterium]
MTDRTTSPAPVILFDGVCNLCSGWVDFVLNHERLEPGQTTGVLKFASLQSEEGRELMVEHGIDPDALDSIVFVEDGRAFQKSGAVLRIAGYLKRPWRWGTIFRFVPPFLRNLAYGLVARVRYRLFGKSETCRVPTPELRGRFLGS